MDIRTVDRIAALLERAVPWVGRVERPARLIAIAGALAATWLAGLAIRAVDPGSFLDWIGMAIVAGLLLAPVGVLLLFVITLRQVMDLPGHLRTLPQTTREQGARLSAAVEQLRQPRQSGARGSARGLWHARRALFELAGLAEPFLGLAGLLRLPFVLLAGLAAVVVLAEVIAAFLTLMIFFAF